MTLCQLLSYHILTYHKVGHGLQNCPGIIVYIATSNIYNPKKNQKKDKKKMLNYGNGL